MRKVLIVCIVSLLLVSQGCAYFSANVQEDFVLAMKENAELILPEYKKYLKQSKLDSNTQRIRTQTADEWMALIDEALEQIEEE